MLRGIDVSSWQGTIDFQKVRDAGYQFVIIRAGYGWLISQKDEKFEANYRNASAAGLFVGTYWRSYAENVEAAGTEAEVCLQAISGKRFEFPVFFDFEEYYAFAKGKEICSEMVSEFCGRLEKAGYFAGLYISRYPLENYITEAVAKRYTLWIAEYGQKLNYNGSYGMWQYTNTGTVPGISGNVDLDECYIDYPSVIKASGLNGFRDKKSNEEIAAEVIKGLWGNGSERRERLESAGYIYDAVQKIVNEMLKEPSLKPIKEVAEEVIEGKWGNGEERTRRLTEAGYNYDEVQNAVNELL